MCLPLPHKLPTPPLSLYVSHDIQSQPTALSKIISPLRGALYADFYIRTVSPFVWIPTLMRMKREILRYFYPSIPELKQMIKIYLNGQK